MKKIIAFLITTAVCASCGANKPSADPSVNPQAVDECYSFNLMTIIMAADAPTSGSFQGIASDIKPVMLRLKIDPSGTALTGYWNSSFLLGDQEQYIHIDGIKNFDSRNQYRFNVTAYRLDAEGANSNVTVKKPTDFVSVGLLPMGPRVPYQGKYLLATYDLSLDNGKQQGVCP